VHHLYNDFLFLWRVLDRAELLLHGALAGQTTHLVDHQPGCSTARESLHVGLLLSRLHGRAALPPRRLAAAAAAAARGRAQRAAPGLGRRRTGRGRRRRRRDRGAGARSPPVVAARPLLPLHPVVVVVVVPPGPVVGRSRRRRAVVLLPVDGAGRRRVSRAAARIRRLLANDADNCSMLTTRSHLRRQPRRLKCDCDY